MCSTSTIVLLLIVASATYPIPADQVQGNLVEIDQVDFIDSDTGSESSIKANFVNVSDLLSVHIDAGSSDGDISRQISKKIRRRQAQSGNQNFYSRMLTYSCPKEAAKLDEIAPGKAKIYLYRHDSKDDISISMSKPATWLDADVDWLVNSSFILYKPTLVYMGGWLQRQDVNWLEEARKSLDELTFNGDEAPFNLIIFDWGADGSMSYGKTAAKVPHFGEVLANFLEKLIQRHRYEVNKLHIVSYSLSTHIAGQAGRKLQENGRGRVRQITAIDPTGVCFHSSEGGQFDRLYSLRPTDAKLVVARHYNMNQLGAGRPIGGVDIFVNGGKSQPRMPIQDYGLRSIMGSMGMQVGSHQRGTQHEASASLNAALSDCHEVAYKCPDLRMFKQGQCADCGKRNESCMLVSTMGSYVLGLKPATVNYEPGTQMHLLTGSRQFCTYTYQVVARLKSGASESILAAFKSGSVQFNLGRNVDTRPRYRLEGSDGNISFTTLLRFNKDIELPERVDGQSSDSLKSLESISINFMSNISGKVRKKKSIRYCPDPTGKLELVNCSRVLGERLIE